MRVGSQSHALTALPRGKRRGTHRTASWVDPRTGLDGRGKFCHHQVSIPGPSIP